MSSFGYGLFNGYGSNINTVLIICAVIGLVLGIVLLVTFLPAKNRGRYGGSAKWLYDFLNFNKYWVSSLVKILHIIVATVCFLGGFICLFILPIAGLALIIGGLLYRLVLELLMVIISIRENVSQINDTLTNMSKPSYTPSPIQPIPTPVQYAAPSPITCNNCGTVNEPGTKFCHKCGTQF